MNVEVVLRPPRSVRLGSAFQRGYEARCRGVSRFSSPYDRPGWGRSFNRAWQDGWEAADREIGEPAPHVNVDDVYPEEEPHGD